MNKKYLGVIVVILVGLFLLGNPENVPVKKLSFTTQSLKALESIESEAGWYTVVVTAGKDHQVLTWFEDNQQLKQLKESTEWRHYTQDSAVFKSQLQKAYGNNYPIICIQDDTGAMRASLGGSQLKSIDSGEQLAIELDRLAYSLRPVREAMVGIGYCPNNICPTPIAKPFDGVIDRADKAIQDRSDAIMKDIEDRVNAMIAKYVPWLLAAIGGIILLLKWKR